MVELVRSFLEQATAQGTRSTIIKPLGWLVALLLAAIVGCVAAGAEFWLIVSVTIFLAISILAYLGAYCYFAWTDPDALRSEKFTINKMGSGTV